MNKAQIRSAVEEILRTMPSSGDIRHLTDGAQRWLAKASAVVRLTGDLQGMAAWHVAADRVLPGSTTGNYPVRLRNVLLKAEADLRLQIDLPINESIMKNDFFVFQERIRQLMGEAKTDILFVDRYLDADFVSKYFPFVPDNVGLRLLTWGNPKRQKDNAALVALGKTLAAQLDIALEVRSHVDFHDRYLIVDRSQVYQCTASFKDGPKAGEALVREQEGSTLHDLLSSYEGLWRAAEPLL